MAFEVSATVLRCLLAASFVYFWNDIFGSFVFSVIFSGSKGHNAGESLTGSNPHPYSHKPFV